MLKHKRKNAAVYIGLGLDISSSSSMEESLDGLGGLSPEFSSAAHESPRTILQVMTYFPVPGGFLLSPLHGDVLQLMKKVAPLVKNRETHLDIESVPKVLEEHSRSSLACLHARSHGSKKKMSIDTKSASAIAIEMPASLEMLPDVPSPTTEIRAESQFALESRRSNAEPAKLTENSGSCKSGVGSLAPKGQPTVKTGKLDVDLVERDLFPHKPSSFDRKRKGEEKGESKFDAAIVDFKTIEEKNNDWGIGPCNDLRNVPVKATFFSNRVGDDDYQAEAKRMHKKCQVNALSVGSGRIESSYHTPVSISLLSSQPDPSESKIIVDGVRYSFERDLVSKHGRRLVSESADLVSEKQKCMEKNLTSYSAGGDLIERIKVHSKLTNKRGIDQNDSKPFKKTRKVDWHSDVERSDSFCKKNTVNECEDNQINSMHCASNGSKNENLKEGNSIILKPEEIVSKVDNISGVLKHADAVLSSSVGVGRLNDELVSENKFLTGKEGPSELRGNFPPSQALDLSELTRRDVTYLQSCTAVASSASMLSCPQRNKNTQEAKDSPVESVSLSPLRKTNIKRLSSVRKDGTMSALDMDSKPIANEIKNIAPRQGSGSGHQLGMSLGKQKSNPRIGNQDIHEPVAETVSLHMKEGKQDICPTSEKNVLSKMKTKSTRSNVEKGVQHGTVKQAIYDPLNKNPVRKDGSMVAFALKEARNLKHRANQIKNKGQVVESTGLYFEAALKFLHVAFLLETPSSDSLRSGDAAQSMKMYSETAKLCNFCAHEYERCKKMAAAALAYKCVEVAYLKAAYYKHPNTSKDRQELQAALRITPGESPSSSASDIDNLNSHLLSKATSIIDQDSSRVAGNHFPPVVCNQGHLLRLLAYINDVNCAFGATRKSEAAITSAAGSQDRGKGVDDGLASVKAVLDFNFNNVNGLLGLIRLSMESISS